MPNIGLHTAIGVIVFALRFAQPVAIGSPLEDAPRWDGSANISAGPSGARSARVATTKPPTTPDAGASSSGNTNGPEINSGRRALRDPSRRDPRAGDSEKRSSLMPGLSGRQPVTTVVAGLAIVLGAFFLLAWALRRGMPKGSGRLPREVVEILGRVSLSSKQMAHLLRLGNKLVLVNLTPSGAETISEVTDQDEVARLIGLCESTRQASATTAFNQVFEELGRRQSSGYFGSNEPTRPTA